MAAPVGIQVVGCGNSKQSKLWSKMLGLLISEFDRTFNEQTNEDYPRTFALVFFPQCSWDLNCENITTKTIRDSVTVHYRGKNECRHISHWVLDAIPLPKISAGSCGS